MVRSRLGIIRDNGVDPTRPDAGHIEGRDHAVGFAEVVPAHAGDFQYGQPLRFKRQHLVGKVYFGQATVESLDRFHFGRCAEKRGQRGK